MPFPLCSPAKSRRSLPISSANGRTSGTITDVADRISREHRSWNMGRIRAKNTKPELLVRSLLHGLGYRYRLHVRALPGCPDIVLPRHRAIIFVHGCFWHRHRNCRYAYCPKSRQTFWQAKFADNVRRDRKNIRALTQLGWRTLVLWECEIASGDWLSSKLRAFLSGT